MAKNQALELMEQTTGNTGTSAGNTAAGAGKSTQQRIDELMGLIGSSRYNYDPNKDPAAQAVRKQYAREGALAARDTMAGYAGMTGGIPSTAAVSAAAQARNSYAAQSADQVAQLEQLNYNRFQDQQSQQLSQLGLLLDQEQTEYSRGRDAVADQRYAEERDYERKYNEAILAAQYGDMSGLEALGIDTSNYGSGGGYSYRSAGSGGSSGSGNSTPTGLPQSALNELRIAAYDNGGTVPPAVWNQYAARYGEDALIDAGLKKGNSSAGRGNSGGQAEREKPGVNDRVNMML